MEMIDRMMTEHTELNEKIVKLREFITKNIDNNSINNLNKDLLIGQLKAMETYLSILTVRIGLNIPSKEEKQLDEATELAKSTISE